MPKKRNLLIKLKITTRDDGEKTQNSSENEGGGFFVNISGGGVFADRFGGFFLRMTL